MGTYFIIVVLLWSAVRGVSEAVVMYFPNPRNHPWFSGYHWFRTFEAGLLIAAAVMFAERTFRRMFIVGALILGWEITEIGYMIARLGQANWHENILGFYSVDGVGIVLALHLVRLLIGGFLIWREWK